MGERGGSVVECRTPEREVGGSKPTAAVLCPWARHFTPRKYWLITQEAVAPSRHDWKIVDWDVKPQHKQKSKLVVYGDAWTDGRWYRRLSRTLLPFGNNVTDWDVCLKWMKNSAHCDKKKYVNCDIFPHSFDTWSDIYNSVYLFCTS